MVCSELIVIEKTRHWIDRVVIGLNLCPFARPVVDADLVRIVCETSTEVDDMFRTVLEETDLLQQSDATQIATTLVVFSEGLRDFNHYLHFIDIINDAVHDAGLEGLVQIASFHPEYCFADADASDPANYSNRSPYPMIHLLREDELERAVLAYPHPEQIPQNNIQRLREMGETAIRKLSKGQ